MVTVTKHRGSDSSFLEAKLAAGWVVTYPNFLNGQTLTVRVATIDVRAALPDANVEIYLGNIPSSPSTPTSPPVAAPAPQPHRQRSLPLDPQLLLLAPVVEVTVAMECVRIVPAVPNTAGAEPLLSTVWVVADPFPHPLPPRFVVTGNSVQHQGRNGCCSSRYSDDGKLKCTPLIGGFRPDIRIA
jgi:hypothetical protein